MSHQENEKHRSFYCSLDFVVLHRISLHLTLPDSIQGIYDMMALHFIREPENYDIHNKEFYI